MSTVLAHEITSLQERVKELEGAALYAIHAFEHIVEHGHFQEGGEQNGTWEHCEQAMTNLRKALNDPHAKELYDSAIFVYHDGRLDHAVQLLRRSYRLGGEGPESETAMMLKHWERELEGVRANLKMLRAQPELLLTDPESWYDLGDTYYTLCEFDEAKDTWARLAAADKGYWSKRAGKMLEKKFPISFGPTWPEHQSASEAQVAAMAGKEA